MERKNGFLISSPEEVLIEWSKINLSNINKRPRAIPVRDFETANNLKSWSDLSPYKHQVTDFIFSDQYFFSDRERVSINFISLLDALIGNKSSHINLAIFTSNDAFDKNAVHLKNELESHLRQNGYNVNLFVLIDKAKQFKEHDRAIITNYFRITCGDSFDIFNTKNKLKTKGTTITFFPLVQTDFMTDTVAVLKNLYRIYEHPNNEYSNTLKNRLFHLIKA